jgi:tyrosine-protein kinase Etk/Wzc
MENKESLIGLVSILIENKKFILRTTLITVIVTALISFFFMDNYYKSSTVFYAASSDLFKPELIFSNGTNQKAMEYYGDDADIDRILTIANSNEVAEYLIKKHDLYKHYDIDSTKTKSKLKVKLAFWDLFEVTKTKYDAIELSIEDVDPKLAAKITNDARNKINQSACNLIKGSQQFLIKSFEDQIKLKEQNLATLSNKLMNLRKQYGVYDFEYQSEAMSKAVVDAEANMFRTRAKLGELNKIPGVSKDTLIYTRANLKGYESEVNELSGSGKNSKFNINRYNEGLNTVSIAYQEYVREKNQLVEDRMRYNQIKGTYNAQISALHLIENGEEPVDKSRPKRTILVIGAGLLAFLLSLIGVLIYNSFKNVKFS